MHGQAEVHSCFQMNLCVRLEFEFRASSLQSRCSILWATPPVQFALIILDMGSGELFFWDGLQVRSSWFQPSGSWDYRHEPPASSSRWTSFFFFFSPGVWIQVLILASECSTAWAIPPTLFCVEYFWDKVSWTISLDWPQTSILIPAYRVARIAGINHWHPAPGEILKKLLYLCCHLRQLLWGELAMKVMNFRALVFHPPFLRLWEWRALAIITILLISFFKESCLYYVSFN
jgi:hypothetical protein